MSALPSPEPRPFLDAMLAAVGPAGLGRTVEVLRDPACRQDLYRFLCALGVLRETGWIVVGTIDSDLPPGARWAGDQTATQPAAPIRR